MKQCFDKRAKARQYFSGDQVIALLPVPGSALQARYNGPYIVERKVGELDYIISTPKQRRRSRLCHVNMLKAYHSCDVSSKLSLDVKPIMSCVPCLPVETEATSSSESEAGFSCKVVEGRLKNSEVLGKLKEYLSHLTESEESDLINLIHHHMPLFSDVPTHTSFIEHDIAVGCAPSIKQHVYCVNPAKREYMRKEVSYMLENGIAEPSFSDWSSPCLLVGKPDGTFGSTFG